MKFIHAADIHLGSPFQGLRKLPSDVRNKVVSSTMKSFENLVDQAINYQIDFMCITGDLFDQPDPDMETISQAMDQLERLNDHDIPVYLSFGNHDYLNDKIPVSIFPSNVHVFLQDVTQKELNTADGTKVGIVSFSYQSRAELSQRIEEYPARTNGIDFQIGMLHGSMDGLKSAEAHYAPFSLNQLQNLNYDYWALGHIHKRQTLSDVPVIAYSGNTQGRHINEPGVKGVSLVTVDSAKQVEVEFLPTSVVEWTSVSVTCEADWNLEQLIDKIASTIETSLDNESFKLVNVNLLSSNLLKNNILSELQNGMVIDRVQRQLDESQFWIHRLSLKIDEQSQVFSKLDEEYWESAEQKVFEIENIKEVLGRLRKYDFIDEAYSDEMNLEELQTQVELMLKQQNALGDNADEN